MSSQTLLLNGSNSTVKSSPSFFDYYMPQLIYGLQALTICFLYGLLFVAIIMDKSLRKRKEMIIIIGMAVSDIIFGLGTLLYAINRWIVIANGTSTSRVSPWTCALTPEFFLQHFGQHLQTIINLVISVERFLAVAYPTIYLLFDTSRATYLLTYIGLSGLIDSVVVYLSIYYGSLPSVTADCPVTVFPLWYSTYFYTFISAIGLLSILVYCAVFEAYRRAKNAFSGSTLNQELHSSVQRRLTVTLGIICCSTLFLYTIPYGIYAYGKWTGTYITIGSLLGNMTRMSSIVNIMIYIARQREIRVAMMKLFSSVIGHSKVSVSNGNQRFQSRNAF